MGEGNNSSYFFCFVFKNPHKTISQRLIDDNFYPVITAFFLRKKDDINKYLHRHRRLQFIKILTETYYTSQKASLWGEN